MANSQSQWQHQLQTGLDEMEIMLSEEQQQKLLDYLALLLKWNKAFNLTAIRDPEEMVSRQLLDSFSILKLVKGNRVLDIGTGPGLPGIPLAIALPERQFTLLDSNGKKTRFVQQAITSLGLKNANVVRERVEAFQPDIGYDTITSRAFASLAKIVQLTSHLMVDTGRLVAMKGVDPVEERDELKMTGMTVETVRLFVPQTSGERHAVLIYRSGD